jgi:hypothetical protein
MQGIPLKTIVTAFAEVREFHALGQHDKTLTNKSRSQRPTHWKAEFNTMSFEELLEHYACE